MVVLHFKPNEVSKKAIVGSLGRQKGRLLIGYFLLNKKKKVEQFSFPRNETLISYKNLWFDADKINPTMPLPSRDSNLLNFIMMFPIPVRWKWACRYLTEGGFQAVKNVVRIMWGRNVTTVSFEEYMKQAPGLHVHNIGEMYATYRTLMTFLRENLTTRDYVYKPDAVFRNPFPLYDYEVAYCMHYLGSQQENFSNAINIVGHLAIAMGNLHITVTKLSGRERVKNFSRHQDNKATDWYFIRRALILNSTTLHDITFLMGY